MQFETVNKWTANMTLWTHELPSQPLPLKWTVKCFERPTKYSTVFPLYIKAHVHVPCGMQDVTNPTVESLLANYMYIMVSSL